MNSRFLKAQVERDRRGGALVLALLVVTLVVGFAASLMQVSSIAARRQLGAVDTKRAFYLADAGLAEAYQGLRIGKTGAVGTRLAPAVYGQGVFWVEATDDGDGRVRLDSTGMMGSARVVLSLVAEPGEVVVSSLAVFTADNLTLVPGTRIDSYDSRNGSYADQRGRDACLEGGVTVGSNGDVTLRGTATDPILVRGDVRAGPARALTMTGTVVVSGDTSPASNEQVLPPIDVPMTSKTRGVDYGGAVPLIFPAGEHGADYLHIGPDAEVVFQGPSVVVLGGLQLAGGSQLTVDTTTGSVTIFVEDYLTIDRGSVVENTTRDPGAFVVQYAGTVTAALRAAGPLEAVVYAPLAQMMLGSGAEIFGSLVGKEIIFTGPAAVHFDRALLESTTKSALPKTMTWRVVDLGQSGGASTDPFHLLGVDPATLPDPAAAHADQVLDVTYVDQSGFLQTYSGMESGFDWTDVQSLESLARDGQLVGEPLGSDPPRTLTAAERATVEYLKSDPPPDSFDTKTRLLAETPLPVEVLAEAIALGLMNSSDLKNVLLDNSPLDAAILTLVLDGTGTLNATDVASVLAAQGAGEGDEDG